MEPNAENNDVLDRVLNPADPTAIEATAPQTETTNVPLDPRIDPNAVTEAAPETSVNEDPTAIENQVPAEPDVASCPAGHGPLNEESVCDTCGYDRKLEVQY